MGRLTISTRGTGEYYHDAVVEEHFFWTMKKLRIVSFGYLTMYR
jgi:hypothetical protein